MTSSSLSVAASLSSETRRHFAIHALAGSEPVSRVADREGVSRKFIYHQKHKADIALDQAFSPPGESPDVLFNLQVTDAWLNQLALSLVLVCHSSFRGVVRLFEDLFDTPISVGTVHNRLAAAAGCAATINAAHGDIFHIRQQCEGLANRLARLAQGSATRRQKAEQRMAGAKQESLRDTLSSALAKARDDEAVAMGLA